MSIYYHGLCAHCGKADVQFTSIACTPSNLRATTGASYVWNVHMTCNACTGPIAVMVETQFASPSVANVHVTVPGAFGPHNNDYVRVRAVFPAPSLPTVPNDVPANIGKTFVEAKHNLNPGSHGSPETCEILCRKVLDTATKRLKPDIGNFNARINALKEEGVITPAMADWAHIVRIDANESTHTEEETTRESAQELLNFTETFLLYAFTLPAMVSNRRNGDGNEG